MKINKTLRQIYSVSDRSRLLNDSDYFIDCMVKYYKPEYKEDCRLLERAINNGAGSIVYQFVQQGTAPTKDERDTFFNLLRNKAGFSTDETNDVIDALFYMTGIGNKKAVLVPAISAAAVLAVSAAIFLFVNLSGGSRIVGEWTADYYSIGDTVAEALTKMETEIYAEGLSLSDEELFDIYSLFHSHFNNLNIDGEINLKIDEDGKCKIRIQPKDLQNAREQIYECYVKIAYDSGYSYESEAVAQEYVSSMSDSIFVSTKNYYCMLKGSILHLSESSKACEEDPYIVIDLPSKNVLRIARDDRGITGLDIPLTLQRNS